MYEQNVDFQNEGENMIDEVPTLNCVFDINDVPTHGDCVFDIELRIRQLMRYQRICADPIGHWPELAAWFSESPSMSFDQHCQYCFTE